MSFLIKIKAISETDKAYQIKQGIWIPKSILDNRGLKCPYYQIKAWWLKKNIEEFYNGKKELIPLIQTIGELKVNFKDLPKDVLQYWSKYWSSCNSNFGGYDSSDRRWEIGEWELGVY